MEKLLRNPSYVNKQGYNGLDLSQVVDFTSSVGHIVPVMWDFLQPGDKVRLQDHLLTRTSPLLSSAFATIEENVRYFFVPMSQIYKPFEQVYNGIQDFGSDFYSSILDSNTESVSDLLPRVQLLQLVNAITSVENFEDGCRLLEGIGVPMFKILDLIKSEDTSYLTHSVNLLPLLAYQKIWYDYFRDTDRIVNDPKAYNMDSFVSTNLTGQPSNFVTRLINILKIQNCPAHKDINNNIFVSPLFGDASVGSNGSNANTLMRVNQWLSGLENVQGGSTDGSGGNTGTVNTDSQKPTTTRLGFASNLSAANLNPANIRALFASEKLLEITRRANKHYDAQILAHFGVDVPTGVDGECFEIGKHTQKLDIGAVISTADTLGDDLGAPLGEIGGKGYQSDVSGKFTFEAKTHGILMAVYYARPRYTYQQDGIDKKLAYVRVSDFPRPEYEDLGMQPVFQMNQNLWSAASSNSNVNGWQYRYSEVKGAYDRVFGGLRRTLKDWAVSRTPEYRVASDFYVSPYDLNQILVVPYVKSYPLISQDQGTTYTSLKEANKTLFDTDPLLHQLSISYQKATKLSTYGISKL